ncbi:MAG: hypothetical protein ACTHU0_19925, partial [Kofleriaceae bacterium]
KKTKQPRVDDQGRPYTDVLWKAVPGQTLAGIAEIRAYIDSIDPPAAPAPAQVAAPTPQPTAPVQQFAPQQMQQPAIGGAPQQMQPQQGFVAQPIPQQFGQQVAPQGFQAAPQMPQQFAPVQPPTPPPGPVAPAPSTGALSGVLAGLRKGTP